MAVLGAAPLRAELAGEGGREAMLKYTGCIGGLVKPVGTVIFNLGGVYNSCPPSAVVSSGATAPGGAAEDDPPGLPSEVDAGQTTPPRILIPLPESVLNVNEAPEPAVEGAAIGSAIATAAKTVGFVFLVFSFSVGFYKRQIELITKTRTTKYG